MIDIQREFIDNDHRLKIKDWICENENLEKFDDEIEIETTSRLAFSVTYNTQSVPDILSHYITDDHNVYNFVGIVTTSSGYISEHIDDDLVVYLNSINTPQVLIKYPQQTAVYYVDICCDMVGGELIYDNIKYKPETNMLVTFPSNEPHAVEAIKQTTKPRIVLVCERYNLLSIIANRFTTPNWRQG